jgi:hypothetical protein
MPFLVLAYIDDHALTATFETAKQAFAEAVEWQLVKRLNDVSINDGTNNFTIAEFSSRMALGQIAETVGRGTKK